MNQRSSMNEERKENRFLQNVRVITALGNQHAMANFILHMMEHPN
jgi:hypothetical protein